jgi:DNA/RNA-binding domain of Phe-tRNA-synthetase-like protein
MHFSVSRTWGVTYPTATVGVLTMRGVLNPEHSELLDARKRDLEARLRSQYGAHNRSELKSLPVLQAYGDYYRRFRKTYHVQLQLESVVFKEKPIPRVSALVEAMFMAELQNLLLTAGHDLDVVQGDLVADVATGAESYLMLNGQDQLLKQGDMFIRDDAGVLSSVIHGPAHQARITQGTTSVVFTVYGPPGIGRESIRDHLEDLRQYVLTIAPRAEVERSVIIPEA